MDPKISSGGSLSPRGDWRAPADGNANLWLAGGGLDVSAAGTVPPALVAAFEAEDWESAVRIAVCLGGDTDTLACITGAAAEAIHGVPIDIQTTARGYLTEDLRAVFDSFEAAMGRPLKDEPQISDRPMR